MEVRKDFGDRMAALADELPRGAIGLLLKALLPREPVKVRAPEGGWKFEAAEKQPSAFAMGQRKRRMKGRTIGYTVNNPTAHLNHRRGTWRAAMVEAVVKSESEYAAIKWLGENYPHLADKGVSLAWCREVGYIS
jgi:hypothetical protein